MTTLLFLTKNLDGASTRYRALNYQSKLHQAGWNTHQWTSKKGIRSYSTLISYLLKSDIVMIQRKLLSTPLLFLVKLLSKKLIYDFDDAIFLKDNGQPSNHRLKLFAKAASGADAVFAGNQYLTQKAQLYNSNVVLLPTTVDTDRYQSAPRFERKQSIDLVWIGSSSTRKYLEGLIPALEELGKRHNRLRLKIIADFDLPLHHMKTLPIKWSDETEAIELASSDIGIAPMIDDPWTRGKCALKIIQYMAAGLPVISSDAGTNGEVVVNNLTGLLVNSQQEWITAVERLLEDEALRQVMAANGLERATKLYSQDYGFKVMINTFNQLLTEP